MNDRIRALLKFVKSGWGVFWGLIGSAAVLAIATDVLHFGSENLVFLSWRNQEADSARWDGDTLKVPFAVAVSFRNWAFREGWAKDCLMLPRGIQPMPIISAANVDKTPIPPFSKREPVCEFVASIPRARAVGTLEWWVTLLDKDGRQVARFLARWVAPVLPVTPGRAVPRHRILSASVASPNLAPGQQTQSAAMVTDANGWALSGRTIAWSSRDTNVARVSTSGVVTALRPGTAVITATSDGVSGSATITVAPRAETPSPGPSVDLKANHSDAPIHLRTGESITLTWTSSNSTSCQLAAPYNSGIDISGQSTISPGHPAYPAAGDSVIFMVICSDGANTASDAVTVHGPAR